MEFNDIIKFEPIDITHIAITIGLALIIICVFKKQLNTFFESLQHRPITVKMTGSETTIELDAPVKPEYLAESIANPQGSENQLQDWEQTVQNISSIEGFQKLGFDDLHEKLSSLNYGQVAAINYAVDDDSKHYFNDKAMLKYLSIASDKIKYLAFYKSKRFVGGIAIEDVISGLASKKHEFTNFGDKIKNGEWMNFSSLITKDKGFEKIPTVKELHSKLVSTMLLEIPFIENNKLTGFLSYKSISDELYAQLSGD